MSNLQLQAESALDGYANSFAGTHLSESCDVSIYSIALPQQPATTLASIKSSLGVDWPETGHSTTSDNGDYRLLGLQTDQVFALVKNTGNTDGQATALPALDSASVTDQSDSWAVLNVKGPNAITALERICPIDLHPGVFGPAQVARTMMEHLAVIIQCESADNYLLLSPRSSAASFLHAVELSLRNTVD